MTVRGKPHYITDISVGKSVMKKGKRLRDMNMPPVELPGVVSNPAKLKDVKNLLEKQFGVNWERNELLVFYKNLIKTV